MQFTHQVRFYHFLTVEDIVESVNLIQMSKQNNGEQLGCYKKVHAKTHRLSKKKDVIVILVLQKTKNSNLFDKNRIQDNVKSHIKNEER